MSDVVTTVILVAVSLAAIVLVWTFVSSMVKKQIKTSESCFGNYDKISINRYYTCYETVGSAYRLKFSLSVGDVNVDKIITLISSGGATKSYTLTNEEKAVTGLTMSPSGTQVKLPGKNGGLTYLTEEFSSKIDLIQIVPVIGGTQCEVADSVSEIEPCI